jgi:hypothetical protein
LRRRVPLLFPYNGIDLSRDLVAGLSVAVVALPVGVAAVSVFNPAVGLYSGILPLASPGPKIFPILRATVKAYLGREGDLSRHCRHRS